MAKKVTMIESEYTGLTFVPSDSGGCDVYKDRTLQELLFEMQACEALELKEICQEYLSSTSLTPISKEPAPDKEYMEINVGDFFIWHSVKVGSGSPVETEVLVTNIKVNSAGQTWITSVDQKGEECWNDLDMFCEQCTPCPKPLDWGQVRRVRLDAEMMAGLRLARQRDDDGLDDTIVRLIRPHLIVEDEE